MELAKSKEPVEAQESKTNADAGEPVASLQLCDELNLNAPELSTHMNNNWKDNEPIEAKSFSPVQFARAIAAVNKEINVNRD